MLGFIIYRKLVVVSIFQPHMKYDRKYTNLWKLKSAKIVCINCNALSLCTVCIVHTLQVYLYKYKPSKTRATYLLPSYCLHSLMFSIPFKDLHHFHCTHLKMLYCQPNSVVHCVTHCTTMSSLYISLASIVLYKSFVVSFVYNIVVSSCDSNHLQALVTGNGRLLWSLTS